MLLDSIQQFYSNVKIIIADDSFETEHITGENIQHYIMPPAQVYTYILMDQTDYTKFRTYVILL